MLVHHFWWHGLYLHPRLATEGTGVLAAVHPGDSLLIGSVSTGARRRLDAAANHRIGSLQPINRKGCSDIVTSLPSVLPFGVSLQTPGGLHRYEPVKLFQELLPGNAVLSTF